MKQLIATILFVAFLWCGLKFLNNPIKYTDHTYSVSKFKEEPKFITGFVLVRDTLRICNKKYIIGESCLRFTTMRRADYTYNIKTRKLKINVSLLDSNIDTLYITQYVSLPRIEEQDIKLLTDTTIVKRLPKTNERTSKAILDSYVIEKIKTP